MKAQNTYGISSNLFHTIFRSQFGRNFSDQLVESIYPKIAADINSSLAYNVNNTIEKAVYKLGK